MRFRAGDGDWAVDVAAAREVRTIAALTALPSPEPGVIGLVHRAGEALAVLSTLGTGRDHVLIVEGGDRRFGIVAREVLGLVRIEDAQLGPPPQGQAGRLVTAVLDLAGAPVLVVDTDVLAGALDGHDVTSAFT